MKLNSTDEKGTEGMRNVGKDVHSYADWAITVTKPLKMFWF
jgi:hypothetical protein